MHLLNGTVSDSCLVSYYDKESTSSTTESKFGVDIVSQR